MKALKYTAFAFAISLMLAPAMSASAQDSAAAPAKDAAPAAAKDAAAPAAKDAAAPAKGYSSVAEMLRKTVPADIAAAANKPKADAGTADEAAKKYIDAVQDYYDHAKTYSASFEQNYETVDGVTKNSTGVVWFKKPGMMRWDYETPESRFLISDGNYFWSWEPVYRQYCKQDLKKSQLPTALTFLAGTGRIEDDFSVKLKKENGNLVQLELTPHVQSLSYEHILFEILMPTGKVYRATVYDAMGNMNKITFKSPELNGELEDSSFQFTPPSDARHICE